MTTELLLIIFLTVACLLLLGFWRMDTARWHEKMEAQQERWAVKEEKLLDRIQSQVPAVLDRQDAHEERRAELAAPKETYGEEESLEAQIGALVEGPEMTAAEGEAIVRNIAG